MGILMHSWRNYHVRVAPPNIILCNSWLFIIAKLNLSLNPEDRIKCPWLLIDSLTSLCSPLVCGLTRYTKALEVIKKLHKEQAQEIKTFKLKLEHLQTLKDSAYKVLLLFWVFDNFDAFVLHLSWSFVLHIPLLFSGFWT